MTYSRRFAWNLKALSVTSSIEIEHRRRPWLISRLENTHYLANLWRSTSWAYSCRQEPRLCYSGVYPNLAEPITVGTWPLGEKRIWFF